MLLHFMVEYFYSYFSKVCKKKQDVNYIISIQNGK